MYKLKYNIILSMNKTYKKIENHCKKGKFNKYKWTYDSDQHILKYKNTEKPYDTSELCSYNINYWEKEFINKLLNPCEKFKNEKNKKECNLKAPDAKTKAKNKFGSDSPYQKLNPSDICNINTCELKSDISLHQKFIDGGGKDYVENNKKIYKDEKIKDTILHKKKYNALQKTLKNKTINPDKIDISEYLIE